MLRPVDTILKHNEVEWKMIIFNHYSIGCIFFFSIWIRYSDTERVILFVSCLFDVLMRPYFL